MSGANVELVTQGFEHLLAGRIDRWNETVASDFEWDISAHPLPDVPDRGNGRDAFRRHMAEYLAGWNDYDSTIEELIDGGDDVVLVLHERARMKARDVVLERDLPTVWTVRDGRSVGFRVFKTRAQALEAAGLSG